MFNQELWEEWVKLESSNYEFQGGRKKYLKKGYTHFDHRIWFPSQKKDVERLIKAGLRVYNPLTKKEQWRSFTPFIKMLIKTPRYRYQEQIDDFDLECKIRPICYASHLDSLIFGYYAFALSKLYESYIQSKGLQQVVLAYRPGTGKSNIQHAKDAFDLVKEMNKKYNGCTVIALDIKGYFDHIDHAVLKDTWSRVIGRKLPNDQFKIFEVLTQYSYVRKESLYRKYDVNEKKLKKKGEFPKTLFDFVPGATIVEKYLRLKKDRLIVKKEPSPKSPIPVGIPQGSPMSSLLSNIYLVDYDEEMVELARKKGFHYRRYCDDILLICPTSMANEIKNYAISQISSSRWKLTIQAAKAEVIDFVKTEKGKFRSFRRKKNEPDTPIKPTSSNFARLAKKSQYLGFEFDGETIFIRASSLSRYFRKMKARLDKTVAMAYSPKGQDGKIRKTQIIERYTHLGQRNFLSYAKKAASKRYKSSETGEWKDGLDSPAILKQISRHIQILERSLQMKNNQRYSLKLKGGKIFKKKKI